MSDSPKQSDAENAEDSNTNDHKTVVGTFVAASIKVTHATLQNLKDFTPEKVNQVVRGGIRKGASRTVAEAQQMIDKIPPFERAGADGRAAAEKVKTYLKDKDASHIQSHQQGGSGKPDNLLWENKGSNRARGDRAMTPQEQGAIKFQGHIENLTGAARAGLGATKQGAIIGAVTTIPFSILKNSLAFTRGDLLVEDAIKATFKETGQGIAMGAVSSFTITTLALACPPFAVLLTFLSPYLVVTGGIGMVKQVLDILDEHKDKSEVKKFYSSLSKNELIYLQNLKLEIAHTNTDE
jgi:hypothetical protein